MKKQNSEISLKDICGILLPKLWIILLVAIVCAGAVFCYSNFFKEDTYTSSFDIYIYNDNSNSTTVGDIQVAEDMLERYEYFIKTDTFLNAVIVADPYSQGLTTEALKNMINISAIGSSGALRISITASDPAYAFSLARKVVETAPETIVKYIPNALKVSVTEVPKAPTAPNSKNAIKNALISFAAAVILTMLIVLVQNSFDAIIHDKKKIEESFSIPVLGVIPKHDVSLN